MLQTGFYTLKIWVATYQLMRQAALQELRIQYGWQAIEAENEALEQAKVTQIGYEPEVLANGDTIKQLLACSRYVARSIQNHYETILNYFDNRSTNASVEFCNRATDRAKIKAFRSQFKGVKKHRILPLSANAVISLIKLLHKF